MTDVMNSDSAPEAQGAANGPEVTDAPTGGPPVRIPGNRVLQKMLERLFAAMVNGPSLNCRPHNSRQRVDFSHLSRLRDATPEASLDALLGEKRKCVIRAKTPQPKRRMTAGDEAAGEKDAAQTKAEREWSEQSALIQKLHTVAEDAKTYEQDTGVHVLNVGFPLLSLPPGGAGAGPGGAMSRRILAPIAFIPVTLTIKRGTTAAVEIACRGEGLDLVQPNMALLAWLEQQTGKRAESDLFGDDEGQDPWREIRDLVKHVCATLDIPIPPDLTQPSPFQTARSIDENNAPRDSAPLPFADSAKPIEPDVIAADATNPADAPLGDDDVPTERNPAEVAAEVPADSEAPAAVLPPDQETVPETTDGAEEIAEPVDPLADLPEGPSVLPDLNDEPEEGTAAKGEATVGAAERDDTLTSAADQVASDVDVPADEARTAMPVSPPQDAATEFTDPLKQPMEADDATGATVAPVASDGGASVENEDDPAAKAAPATAHPALHLISAPRAEDMRDEPTVLSCAILGLFPMANQGLLRDMQEMAGGEKLAGPIESFIRLGISLDVSAEAKPDVPSEPVEQRMRDFASERLIAPADPCQSRAVRLARESRGLVIHGPPGTGKSQTITNIIGDHLARGEKVLFVCEKRTALDVVANRLEHMGLGSLVAIVHDPQRDQRELYRKIREQLEVLGDNKTDSRAAGKLEKADKELQELHDKLTKYRATLVKPDDATGLSFHDMVGQWLATPASVAVNGDVVADNGEWGNGEWGMKGKEPPASATPHSSIPHSPSTLPSGVALKGPALAGLASVTLPELEDRTATLKELFRRADEVEWSANPWRLSVGIDLGKYLARPAEWYRQTTRGWVDVSHAADATADPAIPPFDVKADLAAQATARVALAEELEHLLQTMDHEALRRWAGRSLPEVQAARAKLTEAKTYVQAMHATPLDDELLAAMVASGKPLPTAQELSDRRNLLQKYGDAFSTWSEWVRRVQAGAPRAPLKTIARWISADRKTFDSAQRTLKDVAPLVDRIKAGPPDRDLLAQFRRQPFDLAHLIRWQAAIENYVPISTSWFGFLHGGKKKAAAPVAEFFGLALNPDNGRRLKDFFTVLRTRMELKESLDKVLGADAFDSPVPDDDALTGTFAEHFATIQAAADLQRQPLDATAAANLATITDATDLVHRLIAAELNAASHLFAEYELFPNPENTARLRNHYQGLSIRLMLQDYHHRVLGAPLTAPLMEDVDLDASITLHAQLFDLVLKVAREPALAGLDDPIADAFSEPATEGPRLLEGLRKSPQRAEALQKLEQTLAAAGILNPEALARIARHTRGGHSFTSEATSLADQVDTLEGVIRIRHIIAELPESFRAAATSLLDQAADQSAAWAVLSKAILHNAITKRLATDPMLQTVDGREIQSAFERYRELDGEKRELVRKTVLNEWVSKQKTRLLTGKGERLSELGAMLKRRLMLRGERAMRLRQVVEVGRKTEGGDPLFDICPVWMVSPETVAQLFPREPVFSTIIFDEASQCRLEEALPVLTRGGRVVIAGDPKQLPPTRFFESAIAHSDDEEIETDQQLFEIQQGEVEDLLAAALGLDIRQCYLDVHYRSKNADLIAFSNTHFYGSRLQPIPGHPSNRSEHAPIRLHRVAEPLYEKRENEAEAKHVAALVKELLAEKKPPSIGIACFNLQQRDLITETLDEMAAEDEKFAKKLDAARERTGEGSFEGLFVKNLENVQGDERDHIIISTTYGPDKAGRFYRRFGPLGRAGGGRRLNVLVTRARAMVHLVTSIPAQVYRHPPELESGQTPGGGWLLFAYLKFAEDLEQAYGGEKIADCGLRIADSADSAAEDSKAESNPQSDIRNPQSPEPQSTVRQTRTPSPFAEALSARLAAQHQVGSDVYWGNDGFCIDVALHDPATPDDRTIGVLCDAARFTASEDPMEWDVFRTGILENQGWRLHRVWTPHFFRDPTGHLRTILSEAAEE